MPGTLIGTRVNEKNRQSRLKQRGIFVRKLIFSICGLFLSLVIGSVNASEINSADLLPTKTQQHTEKKGSNTESGPQAGETTIQVVFKTSLGQFVLELDAEHAPRTVDNFLAYVDEGFYNNTLFHRVIPGFVIQGGGMTPAMQKKKTKQPVINESNNGLKNSRGTISMARTAHPDSATSQFFINVADNTGLDAMGGRPGYTVFGNVVEGMDVIDRIVAVPTGNFGMYQDVPKEPVLTINAHRIQHSQTKDKP
ncbi:MAG: peptidyl-prolyl cis-trans isomerase [Pseudomonadales bacterium]|nr:peptidyl-prolyl cis-trans isomerase [Pseudomonadales bacterium]